MIGIDIDERLIRNATENVHYTLQHSEPELMKTKFDDVTNNGDERMEKLSDLFARA